MLKKLVLEGFKSFKHRTAIPLFPGITAIIGQNGSGKCVDGDTSVFLSNGSIVKIRDLVNERLKNNAYRLDDGFLAYGNSVEVLSLDMESLKVVPKKVRAFIKRKAPKELLRIRTKSGREIIATAYHPLFTLKEGVFKAIKAGEIKKGLKVAVPRALNIFPENKYFFELIDLIKPSDKIYVPWRKEYADILREIKKNKAWKEVASKIKIPLNAIKSLLNRQAINFSHLVKILKYYKLSKTQIIELITEIKSKNSPNCCKMLWHNSSSFSRLLGYLMAEGRLLKASNKIWFTSTNKEIVSDYANLMREIFGLNPRINEYKPNRWGVLCYSSPIRTILNKFGMPMNKTEDKKLDNLFLMHSSNEELAEFLSGLYSRDGHISGHYIGMLTKSKKLALAVQYILTRLGISFVSKDVVKIAKNVRFSGKYKSIIIYGAENFQTFYKHVKLVHREKQNMVRKLLLKRNIDFIENEEFVSQAPKELNGLNLLITAKSNAQSLQKLSLLARSDIFWDEIAFIEKIKPKEKWVYDLCVEKHHNFIANNVFVHNSNILDAIFFVLGTRSHALRAERAEHFVFNGGKGNKPSEYASVQLFIENKNGIFNEFLNGKYVPEIVIERKVSRKYATYKFMGKNCNKELIEKILEKANIDTTGFNMLKQDEIAKIVKMSPRERRFVIDKISGIAEYDEKKEKAMQDLVEIELKLRDNEIVLKEREENLMRLEREKESAEKYIKLEEMKKELEDAIRLKTRKNREKEIEELGKKKAELLKRRGEIEKEIEDITLKIKEKEDKMSSYEKELFESYSGKGQLEKMRENIFEREKSLEYKIAQLRSLEEHINEIRRMSELMYPNDISKELKSIEGVHGTLGQLFNVKERFSTAIHVSLGNRINNIVVDNKDVALKCIEYLKEKRLGRATFLPLQDLIIGRKSKEAENALKMKGSIDYASNLIICEPKFRKAFEYVLHDTIVVESHEIFRNLRNVRAVSLEGDLIAKGGEITGGKKPEIRKLPNVSEKLKLIEKLKDEIAEENEQIQALKKLLRERESKISLLYVENFRKEISELNSKKEGLISESINIKIEIGRVEKDLENLKELLNEDKENLEVSEELLEKSLSYLRKKRDESITLINRLGYVNLLAIEEYKRFKEEFENLKSKVEKIKDEMLEIKKFIQDIEDMKREKFMRVLYELSKKFDQAFQKLFNGGEAKLELEDYDDITSGLIIRAHPPNKKPHTIDSLSGGEKTLTAIAFIFAIQEMMKPPFYLLDEIDAALDKNNSARIAEMLREYSKESQIIMVSHNEETVKNVDRVYGVSMRNGISKIRSISLEDLKIPNN